MHKFKRRTDSILEYLRQNYLPFKGMLSSTLINSAQTLRILNMKHKEVFHLMGSQSPDFFYVIQGKVEINKLGHNFTVDALDDIGQLTLFPPNYRTMEVIALTDCTIVQANSEKLNEMTAWDELAKSSGKFENIEEEASINQIKNTKALRKLPIEAIEEIFKRLQRIIVKKGEQVVTQGDEGDAYYIIVNGNAEVWQQSLYDDEQKLVSHLRNGDAFGEEALIMNGTRNATVRMISDGVLFKLNQKDYNELVSTPMITEVAPEVANTMLKNGYQLIDVRFEEEFNEAYIPSAKLIPLFQLRSKMKELNPDDKFLVVSGTGKRASIGALLLKQHHVSDVSVINGGIRDWPYQKVNNILNNEC